MNAALLLSSACRSDWPAPRASARTEIASGRSRKIASCRRLTCDLRMRSGTKKPARARRSRTPADGSRRVAAAYGRSGMSGDATATSVLWARKRPVVFRSPARRRSRS